ncbi:MAG: hypothetical protein JJT76_14420 [Clostridiaceae bacterium]|nr:hypothetical protein [Clostridiaceae bacterium]
MLNSVKKYKKTIVIAGILLLALSSWYVLSNRNIQEDPQKADLVYEDKLFQDMRDYHG